MRQIFLSSKKSRNKQKQHQIIIKYDRELQNIQEDVLNQYIYQHYQIQAVLQRLQQQDFTQYVVQEGIHVYINILKSLRLQIQNYKSYLLNNDFWVSPSNMFDYFNTQHTQNCSTQLETIQHQIQLVYEIFYFLLICSSILTQYLQDNDNLFIHVEPQIIFLSNWVIQLYQRIINSSDKNNKIVIVRLNECFSKILGFFYNIVETKCMQIQFVSTIFPQIVCLPSVIHIPRIFLYFLGLIKNVNIWGQIQNNCMPEMHFRQFLIAKFFIHWVLLTRLSECMETQCGANLVQSNILQHIEHQNQFMNRFTSIINNITEITEENLYQLLEYINNIGLELIRDKYSTGNSDNISSSNSVEDITERHADQYESYDKSSEENKIQEQQNSQSIYQSINIIFDMQQQEIIRRQQTNGSLIQLCMSDEIDTIILVAISMIMQLEYVIISYLVKKYQRLRYEQLTEVINFYHDANQAIFNWSTQDMEYIIISSQIDTEQEHQIISQIQCHYLTQAAKINIVFSSLNISDLCITCETQDSYILILIGQIGQILQEHALYQDSHDNIMSASSEQVGIFDLKGCLTDNPLKKQFIEIFLSDKCRTYINMILKKVLENCQRTDNCIKHTAELNDVFHAVFQIISFLTSQRIMCDVFIGDQTQGLNIEQLADTLQYINIQNLNEYMDLIGVFYNVYQNDNKIQSLAQQFINHIEKLVDEQQIEQEQASELIYSISWILDDNMLK